MKLTEQIADRLGNASAMFPVDNGHAIAEVIGNKIIITVAGRDGSKREFACAVVELGDAG